MRTRLSTAAETKEFGNGDVRRVLVGVFKVTVLFEALLALALTLRLALGHQESLPRAVSHGVFHAGSAFDNPTQTQKFSASSDPGHIERSIAPRPEPSRISEDTMHKAIIASLGLVAALAVWQAPVQADNNRAYRLLVPLSAGEVVPAPGDSGSEGSGVSLSLGTDGGVCGFFSTNGLTMPVTAAHVHRGSRGEVGEVVVTLEGSIDQPNFAGCVETDRKLTRDMVRNRGAYYVDVHTQSAPDGAVRGQLDSGVFTDSATELTSGEVVPSGSGDEGPDTHAFVRYGVSGDGRFCVEGQVDNVAKPLVLDLHQAPAGQNGERIATLYGPTEIRNYMSCVELGPGLGRAINKNPEEFYLDIHNDEYPGGALRAQLPSY